MTRDRLIPRDNEELEREARIQRTVPSSPTQADIPKLERKILGPLWGQRRRKLRGWPKA
jgi:hypothetical protein